MDIDSELKKLLEFREQIRPMLCDTVYYMNKAIQEKKKIIVEGANATMLDIDFGMKTLLAENRGVNCFKIVVVFDQDVTFCHKCVFFSASLCSLNLWNA